MTSDMVCVWTGQSYEIMLASPMGEVRLGPRLCRGGEYPKLETKFSEKEKAEEECERWNEWYTNEIKKKTKKPRRRRN